MMNVLSKKTYGALIACASMALVSACGPKADDTARAATSGTAYSARIAGEVNGSADFRVAGDDFTAAVSIRGATPGMKLEQHVRTGSECSVGMRANSAGASLIPLDADLSSQTAGMDAFPAADEAGSYDYTSSTRYDVMLDDLRAESSGDDAVAKLGSGETFSLAGRYVVISDEAGQVIACGEIAQADDDGTDDQGSGDNGGDQTGDDTGGNGQDKGGKDQGQGQDQEQQQEEEKAQEQEQQQEQAQEEPKDQPKEEPKDQPKDQPKEEPKGKNQGQDQDQNGGQDTGDDQTGDDTSGDDTSGDDTGGDDTSGDDTGGGES